jgi:NAD(P)-dependent dehydrogenase (short-subunit alcohol dehydrogenase family)
MGQAKPSVAVITGAASGLGLAITKSCMKRGMHVVMADNNVTQLCDEVEQLSNQFSTEVLGVVTDVTSSESVHQLVQQVMDHFGAVNLLFNNAGICGQLAPAWEMPNEHLQNVMDVNVFGVINCIRAFMPKLLQQSTESRIVNMSSLYGLCSGSQLAAYAMSKAAVVSLSESMFYDLQQRTQQVKISVVCPSFVNTQLLFNSPPLREHKLYDKIVQLMEKSRPADDVANAILVGIDRDQFYILPDQEVKLYCEQRMDAIEQQSRPYTHTIEALVQQLHKRVMDNSEELV